MKARRGCSSDSRIVMLPSEITGAHSHRRSHSVVHHVEELRDSEHHLVSRQCGSADPSHHDGAQTESRRLHSHLQTQRETYLAKVRYVGTVDGLAVESLSIDSVSACAEEHNAERNGHDDAREHGR